MGQFLIEKVLHLNVMILPHKRDFHMRIISNDLLNHQPISLLPNCPFPHLKVNTKRRCCLPVDRAWFSSVADLA